MMNDQDVYKGFFKIIILERINKYMIMPVIEAYSFLYILNDLVNFRVSQKKEYFLRVVSLMQWKMSFQPTYSGLAE